MKEIPPHLQKVLDRIATLTARDITLELIEPLAHHALAIEDDEEWNDFVTRMPNNVLGRFSHNSALQAKAQGYLDRQMAKREKEVHAPADDNRFERVYEND